MAKRKGSPVSRESASSSQRESEGMNEREAREGIQWLEKLPPEVWEKVLDELEENDLFPLALSCRYFRQKQKELVARTRQKGKPCRALKTTLHEWPVKDQPASAEYLQFCYNEKAPCDCVENKDMRIRNLAAYHGHLSLLQELLEPFDEIDKEIVRSAAHGGHLETLQWLKTQEGFRRFPGTFAFACEGGHWETIRWLRSEGCPWNVDACTGAARRGHLEVLKWLRSEGCPWNAGACACAAAGGGQLAIVKWLRSEGCPWDKKACKWAARGGHLEVLKWLRSEGCPWDKKTCYWAARCGHLDVLEWAIENGCSYEVHDTTRPAFQSLGLA